MRSRLSLMVQIKPTATDSPGCHQGDSMSAFPTLSDAASAADVSLANKKSTLAPLDTSTLLVRSSCFPTSSVHMQLDSSSRHFHPGWHTHTCFSFTHTCPYQPWSLVGWTRSVSQRNVRSRGSRLDPLTQGKKKMQRRYLFQSLTQFQEIIGRYFKDADDQILKKNVKIQLANRVWHDLRPFWINKILMVTVGEVASLVLDQSFSSRNHESLLLLKTQTRVFFFFSGQGISTKGCGSSSLREDHEAEVETSAGSGRCRCWTTRDHNEQTCWRSVSGCERNKDILPQ